MLKDKIILITGGTGSFGFAATKLFLSLEVREIRIFSRDEKKQNDMRIHFNNKSIKFYLGDVRDISSIDNAMKGVNYVFHAAALKQVPSCEFFPMEAVKTNIIGTENVLNSAISNFIEKVVCLSTDKAAYPINAMGISKALMEKIFIAKAKTAGKTIICGTRYGNVMASRGSVIPLFINQIMSNKGLSITDPTMTRFIMSLDEAVKLVLFAFKEGEQGDIFVQKSPAATTGDLATAISELFNHRKKIMVIGPRHGEKKYETLITKEEFSKVIDFRDYYKIPDDTRDLNYNKYFFEGSDINLKEEYNSKNTERLTVSEIKEKLLRLDFIQEALGLAK